MNYFGDEWGGGDNGWGAKTDEPVVAADPPQTQQAPIGHETAKKSPITQPLGTRVEDRKSGPLGTRVEDRKSGPLGTRVEDRKSGPLGTRVEDRKSGPVGTRVEDRKSGPLGPQTQTPAGDNSTHYEPPKQASHSGFGKHFGDFQDEWGDSDLTGAMSSTYTRPTNIIPDTAQTNLPPQQPEQAEKEEEAVAKKEEEKVVVPVVEPRQSAPKKETRAPQPAQAERNDLIMGSSVGEWGKQNIQNLAAKSSSKRRNNRRAEKPARKGPINTQSAAPAAQAPVGSAPSKHQVTTEPSSVNNPLVQSLMDKVHALELKVEELESRQIHQLGGVCTLNSTGKVNHEFNVIWDSTNHIIRPQKGLRLVEPEKVLLEVDHRGLYQITFTTCGTNPQLIINNHVYAAARSAAAIDSRTAISSTSCVNIYLYLDEKATIAGRVTAEIASENPCEHWLCVRLVHQGF